MKKHKIKAIGIMICIIIAVLAVYTVPFIILFDTGDIHNSVKDIVSIFTCITAGLGALFSGVNIAVNVKHSREDRQVAFFTHWYNELIVNKHFSKITTFFELCDELAAKLNGIYDKRAKLTGDEYDKMINEIISTPFTSSFTRIRQELVSDTNIIDKSLSDNISIILEKFQDDFFSCVCSLSKNPKISESIRVAKHKIFKLLIDYNKEILQGSVLLSWPGK